VSSSPSNSETHAPAPENAAPTASTWKDEIAARVRAHRSRTPRPAANQPALPGMENAVSSGAIAARVAERYSRLPSWREMLAAQAAAKSTVDSLVAAASAPPDDEPPPEQLSISTPPPAEAIPEPWQPDLLRYSVSSDSLPEPRSTPPQARASIHAPVQMPDSSVADPLEDAVVEPSHPLPATLVTTPRELVAPRKARPRLAEGPLLEPAAGTAVASRQESVAHSPADASTFPPSGPDSDKPEKETQSQAAPTWHSIHLDSETPIRQPLPSSRSIDEPALHVAPLADRAMAALVDCALTLCAFLLFCLVFALSSTHLPHGRIALVGACAILFAMGLLYQFLFFTLTDATPGMRYAKIALCTFADENPTRSALRGRIGALLLSALPLGLGFLWAVFDEDSLGWHDRITRTYQRSFRAP
jgi:uncharacterized RDD family membrane protein YckC